MVFVLLWLWTCLKPIITGLLLTFTISCSRFLICNYTHTKHSAFMYWLFAYLNILHEVQSTQHRPRQCITDKRYDSCVVSPRYRRDFSGLMTKDDAWMREFLCSRFCLSLRSTGASPRSPAQGKSWLDTAHVGPGQQSEINIFKSGIWLKHSKGTLQMTDAVLFVRPNWNDVVRCTLSLWRCHWVRRVSHGSPSPLQHRQEFSFSYIFAYPSSGRQSAVVLKFYVVLVKKKKWKLGSKYKQMHKVRNLLYW